MSASNRQTMKAKDFEYSAHLLIENELSLFVEKISVSEILKRAARESLFPAGKRIRPLICLTVCNDLGGTIEVAASSAIALELLHTASIIHDDMPALDNDDLRRGKPSCHKAFGEGTALLVGDLLISSAFEAVSMDERCRGVCGHLVHSLSAAFRLLCDGQQLDILPKSDRGSIRELHLRKTGALFGASFEVGSICSGSAREVVELSRRVGELFGLCFQLADDFDDNEITDELHTLWLEGAGQLKLALSDLKARSGKPLFGTSEIVEKLLAKSI